MADDIDKVLDSIVKDLGDFVAAKSKEAVHNAEELIEADLAKVYSRLRTQLQRLTIPSRVSKEE